MAADQPLPGAVLVTNATCTRSDSVGTQAEELSSKRLGKVCREGGIYHLWWTALFRRIDAKTSHWRRNEESCQLAAAKGATAVNEAYPC